MMVFIFIVRGIRSSIINELKTFILNKLTEK